MQAQDAEDNTGRLSEFIALAEAGLQAEEDDDAFFTQAGERWAWVRPKIQAGGGAADNSGGARRARDARGYARRVRLDGRGRHAGGGRRQDGARPAVEGGKAGRDQGRRWRARRGRRRKVAEAARRAWRPTTGNSAAREAAQRYSTPRRGAGRGGGLGLRAWARWWARRGGGGAAGAVVGAGVGAGAARRGTARERAMARWRGGGVGAGACAAVARARAAASTAVLG
ncbi:uncharacterized protein [Miscanthus floridulus]|uniref:uncharacterized protein n=1 Tax=Miscanthus floridulus TaxID=154761 RepID=UPI003458831D